MEKRKKYSRAQRSEMKALVRAVKNRQKAEHEFGATIWCAHREGLTYREIGELVGLSHARVGQIIREKQSLIHDVRTGVNHG
jgi:DNA-directed RNA polymerase specialized sigma subunit